MDVERTYTHIIFLLNELTKEVIQPLY